MMRILLVDDHVLFREGLAVLLNAQPDMQVVGEAGTGDEGVALSKSLRPDLILLDFGLPHGTGLEAMHAILANQPDAKIVFLTMHEENQMLIDAIRGGAKGYVIKHEPLARLLAYIRGVERGQAAISPELTTRLFNEIARSRGSNIERPEHADLSPREVEVFEHLTAGASNREIARRLVIAENTVRKHVSNILQKLHLRTRREVIGLSQHRDL